MKHVGEKRFPKLKYITYLLMFPDGDTWCTQSPFVESLDVELKNMIAGHKDKGEWGSRAMKLRRTGDVWWKDANGVEHRMLIENRKRNLKWGTGSKKGLGEIKHGVEPPKSGEIIT